MGFTKQRACVILKILQCKQCVLTIAYIMFILSTGTFAQSTVLNVVVMFLDEIEKHFV